MADEDVDYSILKLSHQVDELSGKMGKGRSKKRKLSAKLNSPNSFSVSGNRQGDVEVLKQNINKSKTHHINFDRSLS